ncbi:MAG: hypothetical protein NC907_05630 [Candidatus Omnitrophica bacterium]|nr:hypothetical protein [Candidatus Omnitrophota bacterium]
MKRREEIHSNENQIPHNSLIIYAKLSAASKSVKPELFILQGKTHEKTASTQSGYIACTGFLFDKISLRINEKLRSH